MKTDLKYQISFLGNCGHIIPDQTTINLFKNALSEYSFVPCTFVETVVSPQGVFNKQRLKLSTNDGAICIEFKSGRIDFYQTNIDIGAYSMQSIDAFSKMVKSISNKISTHFPPYFNRVGFVRYSLFIDGVSHQAVYRCLNSNIKYYEGLEMKDWSNYLPASIVSRTGIGMNAVSTIKHFKNNLKINSKIVSSDGVLVITDVNTLAESLDSKYDLGQVHNLLDEMQEIEYKLCSQFSALIGNCNEK